MHNRREKRDYLKRNTTYFTEKSRMLPNEWYNLVESNIQNGNKKQEELRQYNITRNSDILTIKENMLRFTYQQVEMEPAEIETRINIWYSRAIKENSFMTENY